MLQVVFFDAAGTLFDARAPIAQSYARIAQKYGVNAEVAAVNAAFRRAFHAAPGLAFGPGHCADDLRVLERRWWYEVVAHTFAGLGTFTNFEAYFDDLFAFFGDPASWEVDRGGIVTLQTLRDQGLHLGMVSNFDYRLYRILDGLGLGPYFDSVTISSEAGFAKPAPEIFQVAMAKHNVVATEAIHIGDSPHHDVAGARAAGIPSVLIDPQAPKRLIVEDRSACVKALDAVVDAVQGLAKKLILR